MEEILKSKHWTLQEILNLYPSYAPLYPHQASGLDADWFTKMIADAGLAVNFTALGADYTEAIIKGIINTLLFNIYNRHDKDYMFSVVMFHDQDYTLTTEDFKVAINPILNVLELTAPRYIPLLKQSEKYSNDPTGKISSVTTGRTRFNDTPQDEGEFNDEEHATNVSKTITDTQVDVGSIMSRLEELFKNYRSIILAWSNEFNQLFYKEEQL